MFPTVAARNVNPSANAGSQPGHGRRSRAIHKNQDERLGECPSSRLERQSLVEAACDWEQSSEIHNTLPIHLCGRTSTTCDCSATSPHLLGLTKGLAVTKRPHRSRSNPNNVPLGQRVHRGDATPRSTGDRKSFSLLIARRWVGAQLCTAIAFTLEGAKFDLRSQ